MNAPVRNMLTVAGIQAATARHYGIRLADLTGRSRKDRDAQARQTAMYLAHTLLGGEGQRVRYGQEHLGRLFNRDHSTVHHAIRAVEQRLADGHEPTCRAVEEITRELTGERG